MSSRLKKRDSTRNRRQWVLRTNWEGALIRIRRGVAEPLKSPPYLILEEVLIAGTSRLPGQGFWRLTSERFAPRKGSCHKNIHRKMIQSMFRNRSTVLAFWFLLVASLVLVAGLHSISTRTVTPTLT